MNIYVVDFFWADICFQLTGNCSSLTHGKGRLFRTFGPKVVECLPGRLHLCSKRTVMRDTGYKAARISHWPRQRWQRYNCRRCARLSSTSRRRVVAGELQTAPSSFFTEARPVVHCEHSITASRLLPQKGVWRAA